MGDLKEIQLGSLLATTPEALQRIADSEAVARNLRDMFPHPYTLEEAKIFIENVKQGKMGYVYGIYRHLEELVGVISMTPGRDVNSCSAYKRESHRRASVCLGSQIISLCTFTNVVPE